MTPTLIQIPTLNDAPRDFCVLNKNKIYRLYQQVPMVELREDE
jgi:hypothetical protein